MQTYETLTIERDGDVALITLNRPTVLNALNRTLLSELRAACAALDVDVTVRAIVITGAGDRAFAAGADIGELNALDDAAGGEALARRGQELTLAIERMRVPVIAAVNGFALGGGCELAMSADIRIASENARFGQPEIKLGLIPGYGGTQRTARLVGRGMAMYLCLAGDPIDAREALRIGLVEFVVAPDRLREEALRIAHAIAANAPLAAAAIKCAINDGAGLPIDEALAVEARAFGTVVTTNDFREGTTAFLEKRKASFTGT